MGIRLRCLSFQGPMDSKEEKHRHVAIVTTGCERFQKKVMTGRRQSCSVNIVEPNLFSFEATGHEQVQTKTNALRSLHFGTH